MQNVKKIQVKSYETEIDIKEYKGRNSFGSHSALPPSESRELINWDLFAGISRNFLKSRRGSAVIKPTIAPHKRGPVDIINCITWDVGTDEYLFTQEGTQFYYQNLIDPTNRVLVEGPAAEDFSLGSEARADLVLSGDKLFIFHPTGNKIIHWDGIVFYGISMGLAYPYIETIQSSGSGVIIGTYVVGIEKVYQIGGVDHMASTPNRKLADSGLLAEVGPMDAKKIAMTIRAAELDGDTLWTHLRVWRTKNKNMDTTDPNNPIAAQGFDDELYEESLITRAEIEGPFVAIATGPTLPPGNAGVTAGVSGGFYTIVLNNTDDVFLTLIGIDKIELLPLPAASIGCYHGKRIFVSAVEDSALDELSKANIYYSNFAGTKYSTQYDPLNAIITGGDGQRMMRLISLEQDLIGIKEAKTGRLQGGDVDLPFETMDQHIGINDPNLAAFVPAVGIVAVTNDHEDFRIFGYDLRWTNTIHGLDISIPIRAETSTFVASMVSFGYVNGKLIISDGTGICYALHETEKRGWTKYEYPMNGVAQRFFTFANGRRAAFVSKNTYLVEVEVSGTDSDYDTSNDTIIDIPLSETTWRFQSNDGRDNLEHQYLALAADLTTPLIGTPYVNGLPWPNGVTGIESVFVPDPGIFGGDAGLKDTEFRLYIEPATVGEFLWCRLRANFIHYVITTIAPATIRSKRLFCSIDQDGSGSGIFDPFVKVTNAAKWPAWGNRNYLVFNFDADSDILYEMGGGNFNHVWDPGAGGTRTHIQSMPPLGGEQVEGIFNSGFMLQGFQAMDYIGDDAGLNSRDLAFRFVISFPGLEGEVVIQHGGDGVHYWIAKVNDADSSLEFQIKTSALSYKFTTPANAVVEGATSYTLIFFLTAGGAEGQWYCAPRTDEETVALPTTRSIL